MPKKIEGGSDNWRTPQELWDLLNSQYHFSIDLCASKNDAKTKKFLTNLSKDSIPPGEIAWINPPFSKAKNLIPIPLDLDAAVVGIYRSDNTENALWQDHIFKKADWVFFLRGRVKYEDPFGTRQSPMFPSALWGKGVPPPEGLNGYCARLR